MNLGSLVRPDLVFPNLESSDGLEILRTLARKVFEAGAVKDSEALYEKLLEREEIGSTAMGVGVAIPHCKLAGLKKVILAVGLVPGGVDLDAPDEKAVHLFFVVISPPDSSTEHLKCLAMISKWIRQTGNVERLSSIESKEEICRCLESEEGS